MNLTIRREGNWETGKLISNILVSQLYSPDEVRIKATESSNKQFFCGWIFVFDNEKPVGQFALYDNPNLIVQSEECLVLGNYESVNEEDVANFLFQSAIQEAKTMGKKTMLGPMNGSTWETHRLPVETGYVPFFTETIYKEWYPILWENAGFAISERYRSNVQQLSIRPLIEVKTETRNRIEGLGLIFRTLNMENFEVEMEAVYRFSLEVFKNNVLYTPISKIDFLSKYLPLKHIIDPRFVELATDTNGEIVALFFCIPDLYDKTGKTLVAKTIGRHENAIYSGMTHILYEKLQRTAIENGFERIIHAFFHEANTSGLLSSQYSGETMWHYNLYYKMIN